MSRIFFASELKDYLLGHVRSINYELLTSTKSMRWVIDTTPTEHSQHTFSVPYGHVSHVTVLAPVVQRLDNAIHWINEYPADKC